MSRSLEEVPFLSWRSPYLIPAYASASVELSVVFWGEGTIYYSMPSESDTFFLWAQVCLVGLPFPDKTRERGPA